MYKRIHVIVNPAAGRDVPILGTLNKRFAEAGIDWDIFVTKEAGDARRLRPHPRRRRAACAQDGRLSSRPNPASGAP